MTSEALVSLMSHAQIILIGVTTFSCLFSHPLQSVLVTYA